MTSTTAVNSSVYSNQGLTGTSGSSSSSNASAASDASAAASTAINEQDFLQLMTTQLQDQNPLQPVSNAEFFSQIAQFSTVSGINQLNSNFTTLASQLSSSQSLQAASLVGQYVLVPGSQAPLDPTTGITGAVDVPSSGDVKVNVKDSSGALVATLDLGTQSAGSLPFSWNGQDAGGDSLPAGTYTISATVSSATGSTAAPTEVASQVTSVTLNGSGGLMLNLKGVGQVPFSQVTQII